MATQKSPQSPEPLTPGAPIVSPETMTGPVESPTAPVIDRAYPNAATDPGNMRPPPGAALPASHNPHAAPADQPAHTLAEELDEIGRSMPHIATLLRRTVHVLDKWHANEKPPGN